MPIVIIFLLSLKFCMKKYFLTLLFLTCFVWADENITFNKYSINDAVLTNGKYILGACDILKKDSLYTTKNLTVCIASNNVYEPTWIGKSSTLLESNITDTTTCDMVIGTAGITDNSKYKKLYEQYLNLYEQEVELYNNSQTELSTTQTNLKNKTNEYNSLYSKYNSLKVSYVEFYQDIGWRSQSQTLTFTHDVKAKIPNYYNQLTTSSFAFSSISFMTYVGGNADPNYRYLSPSYSYNSNTGILTVTIPKGVWKDSQSDNRYTNYTIRGYYLAK